MLQFFLILFLAFASFASAANVSHPMGQLPAFACSDSPADCYDKAAATLQARLLPFDPAGVAKMNLKGPSEFFGTSQYGLVGHRTPYVFVTFHGIYEDGRQLAPQALYFTSLGMNLLHIVLPGHGKTNLAAGEISYQDWLEEA